MILYCASVYQDNAIEVFMKNGHSAFLVFLNRDHVSAYKRYSSIHTDCMSKLQLYSVFC